MKHLLFVLLCGIYFSVGAQQQYQSLLWKISGNGTKGDSYLYGTMHVSSKVAYRLDDIFYTSLLKVETVALESDPNTWLENSYEHMQFMMRSPYSYRNRDGFYSRLFKLTAPEEAMVRSAIRFDHMMINSYLYRKDQRADNFEEETYLDMFIYQAGKKNGKKIIALEDLDESRYLTTRASYNPVKKNPDAWVQKLFEKEDPRFVRENAYRNRDLDLLDSIGMAVNTNFFRQNMLYHRNENMTDKLDSLLKTTTVFAGVGAAHLPGEKGMIAMLRKRGYTVSPLTSRRTKYAENAKDALEKTFSQVSLTMEYTPDGFIGLKSFDKLREFSYLGQSVYWTPDMTNGAYLTITRLNTYDPLSKKKKISLAEIDDLLYEDIPGTLLEKKQINSPFPGVSILNKTKKGDYQKYHIYKTPLEIIIIKYAGKRDHILRNADIIFNSIRFKTVANDWETLAEVSGKYHFSLPQNYSIQNYLNAGRKIIQSYSDTGYFFFQEVPEYDLTYIEEDAFEASYFHESFYKNYELKAEKGAYANMAYKSYVSSAKMDSLGENKLHLKTIVKDHSYYMMGYIGSNVAHADRFFNSFGFDTVEEKDFEMIKDSVLHFSAISAVQPKLVPGSFRKKTKPYNEQQRKATYTTPYNERIFVKRNKFHDLHMYKNIDSLWHEVEKKYRKNFEITHEKKSILDSIFIYTFLLKDTSSIKRIRVKNILVKGTLFELKTMEDSISGPSEFTRRFYDTFKPLDTLLGQDVFADKTQQFFDALKKNDSMVLQSYKQVRLDEKNTAQIIDVLSNHDFPENRKFIKYHLIRELGKIQHPRALNYLSDLYLNSYADPHVQTTILKAFIDKSEETSYHRFLNVLEQDFPLDASGVQSLFKGRHQEKVWELRRSLFPDLLEYTVVEEYKAPVYELLAQLKDSNHIKVKSYKKYKSQLLNDARVELKRNLGKKKNVLYKKTNDLLLSYYMKLLFPFRKEKKIAVFFDNLLKSNNKYALVDYHVLLEKEGLPIPSKLIEKTIKNTENLYMLVEKLYKNRLYAKIQTIDSQAYAQSKLFEKVRYDKSKDSINFLEKHNLEVEGLAHPVMVYFYKLKREYGNASENYQLHYIAFEKTSPFVVKPYYISPVRGIIVRPTKTLEAHIEEALNKVRYRKRRRIHQ